MKRNPLNRELRCAIPLFAESADANRSPSGAGKPDFREHLLGGPKVDEFNTERRDDTGREGGLETDHHLNSGTRLE